MIKKIDWHNFIVVGIPLTLLLFAFILVRTPQFLDNPSDLSIGLTLDLLITMPLLYFLVIRKTTIPKISVLSVFIIGIIVASFLIPPSEQALLGQIKFWAVPLAEFGIVGFVIFTARKTIAQYKAQKGTAPDFYTAINQACREAVPNRIGALLATEISVIYYVFFSKKKKTLAENEYTYHKKSGIITVVYAVLFMAFIETFAVHLVVHTSYPKLAWVLTFFSAYACIQIIALIRSIGSRPSNIDFEKEQINLRYGFFSETTIPFNVIDRIELNTRSLPTDNSVIEFSPLGLLDTHNIILHLNKELSIQRIYGITKQYQSLAIYIDEKDEFFRKISDILRA